MKEIITEWRQFLTEEVFGVQAFVYHGSDTPPEQFLDYLLNDDFKAGEGAGSAYGKGLYTVYDLANSPTEEGKYGSYIYKLKVGLYGCISFDRDITKLIYKDYLSPVEQARLLNKDELIPELAKAIPEGPYTSKQAQQVAYSVDGRVKGLIFTGGQDGKVVVIYDPSIVVPVSYKKVGEENWTPVDKSKIKPALARSASDEWEEFKFQPNMRIIQKLEKKPFEERIVRGDLSLKGVYRNFKLPLGLKVEGNLELNSSKIMYLPSSLMVSKSLDLTFSDVKGIAPNTRIGEDLILIGTSIGNLPEDLQVGGKIIGFRGKIKNVPKHLRGKIGK
jgi:hypothetical protein